MKYILLILPLLVACNSTEDIVKRGYSSFCNRQPESMSCISHEDIGHTPTSSEAYIAGIELYRNFTYITDKEQYGTDEYWFDNELISKKLEGDCEDISLTFISQLLLDGVNPSNIRLVASGTNGRLKHYYAKVKLDNGEYYDFYKIDEYTDIMYMQYDNIGVFVK